MEASSTEQWGWENFFTSLGSFIESSERQYEGGANHQYSEYAIARLAMCSRNIAAIKEHIETAFDVSSSEDQQAFTSLLTQLNELLLILNALLEKWQLHQDELEQYATDYSYQAPTQHDLFPSPGRPQFHIPREQLEYLHSLYFTWTDIANILGVSRMTIYRRRAEYGLIFDSSTSVSDVSDVDLAQILQDLRREMPEIGESMVWGRLRSMGLQVTRERVRQAIRRTDPLNTALRWRDLVSRRPYSVPGPNSLWHIGKLLSVV